MSDEEAAKLASTNAAAASAVSALRMITEEMLNKTTNELKLVASETSTLKQEETEVGTRNDVAHVRRVGVSTHYE